MLLTRRRTLALSAAVAAGSALPVRAQQNWPQRPLRILVGTSPGGSPDIISRLLADKMAGPLGQSITIENNTGGGGGIAAAIVSRAPPDGYIMTLLTAGYASGAAVGKFPFDGDSTFACITMVCSYPFVFSVPKDSPIKSFPDMLARAKAQPGKLSYVITSLGAVYHLIGTWVGMKAGVDMVPISYRGSPAAVTDVLAGRVDVMLEPATSGFPRVATGQFRALALTSPVRYPLMPDAPTVADTLPGRAVHVLARHGGGPAHAAADRRSPERRDPPRSGSPGRRAEAQGRRQHRHADDARGDAAADRGRDRALEADRRSQSHQGQLIGRDGRSGRRSGRD